MINNDKIELFNGIALLKDDQCICRFIRETGRLDHDKNMLPIIISYIPIGGVVIDIGAFIGDHTIAYAKKVGQSGKVIAYEPSKDAFDCLRHNIKDFKHIIGINCMALGSEKKIVPIEIVGGNNGMNFIPKGIINANIDNEKYESKVVVKTMDDSLWEIQKIDFIKIDVEGYELDVLIGGKQTINKFKPTMLIEINDATLSRQGISRNDIFAWLTENNYIYRNIYKEQGLNDSQLDIICTPNDIRNT